MKVAIISDIHGNLEALKAVLNDIDEQKIEKVFCLGDIATLGPSPKETMALVELRAIPSIIGNHEQAILDPDNCEAYGIRGAVLAQTVRWCRERLTEGDLDNIKKYSEFIRLEAFGRTALLYHGSPNSTTVQIMPDAPDEEIDSKLLQSGSGDLLIGGHTHMQMYRKYKGMWIVNSGSVGCAFSKPTVTHPAPSILPVAEYAVVDVNDGGVSINLRTLNYDIKKFAKKIMNSDIPLKSWWQSEFLRLGIV